ncbi:MULTISPECIES: lytic murein transglycosylase [Phyllobacteriaceae]|jgi:lytic murein transglycosylase|uniref:Lytic transglycosylase n=2 Tax=Pseudomonadota TaxID=1224 RepID=A0A1C2DYR1_9HYPH|nr:MULTISPECIES: lytic murein transglycosylase [Mesorhizobium]MBN9234796.1 lytic murein transglycosylase [Mesorhizobium sp.]MDQ0328723.1 lytic murein transglycosylase [Mesorhizobium sp. YL-MeA3-2017]OCX19796.1 lytic transglycosylase [Mesorhizobium hungaricum]
MRLRSQLIAALLPVLVAAPAMAQESAPTQQQVTPAAGVQPDAGAGAQFDPTAAPCGGDFDAWKQGITEEAKAAGVGAAGLEALEDSRIDTRVLARDRSQGVFSQTFTQFSGRMISAYRLKQGAAMMQKYGSVFARAQQEFGVQPAIVTAFWALETDFGAVQGDFGTLNALVTLSHDCRRPATFRRQIVPLLKLIDRGDLPADVKGAWAGEIGQTQMLPIDYLEDSVDGDGDGKVDLRNSAPDVIMTTAKKLEIKGWKRDQPWVQEVRVPDTLPWEQTARTNKMLISQWNAWGLTNPDGSPLKDNGLKAGLALPMGRKGPAFLTYENFDVYIEWNQSFTYALTAAVLATRFAGAPAYDPRDPEPGLSMDQMKELQNKLEAKGYDVGKVDGILGTNTRDAVRKEQIRLGIPADGWPTPDLLAKLSS